MASAGWEQGGAGGYSAVRITAVRRPETGRYSAERITGAFPQDSDAIFILE